MLIKRIMSRIGKKIISIPQGVSVTEQAGFLVFKKDQKEIKVPLLAGLKHNLSAEELSFEMKADSKQFKSNRGTAAALSLNAIVGLTEGFEKSLQIEGIGFKVVQEPGKLVFNLGFSHQIDFPIPAEVEVAVEKNKFIKIRGFDKALVGQVAANIRALKKPEPYKGKGIRYEGEVVKLKAGKKAVASSS